MKKIKKVNKINFCSIDQYQEQKCPCRCTVVCECTSHPERESLYVDSYTYSFISARGQATPDYQGWVPSLPIINDPGIPAV